MNLQPLSVFIFKSYCKWRSEWVSEWVSERSPPLRGKCWNKYNELSSLWGAESLVDQHHIELYSFTEAWSSQSYMYTSMLTSLFYCKETPIIRKLEMYRKNVYISICRYLLQDTDYTVQNSVLIYFVSIVRFRETHTWDQKEDQEHRR